MGESERKLEAIAATLAQAIDQQSEECMKPLFSLAKVTDAQKLQRPFVDSIHSHFVLRGDAAGKTQISEGFDADAFTAEAVSPQAIASLEKRQGHPLGLLTGAVNTAEAVMDLKNAALASRSRVDQHGLVTRHRHQRHRGIGKKPVSRESHGRNTSCY
tara:strand:- start:190 stop:663 length:474 start_codon:yes stop_codon:yes gene_type:complete